MKNLWLPLILAINSTDNPLTSCELNSKVLYNGVAQFLNWHFHCKEKQNPSRSRHVKQDYDRTCKNR